MDRDDDSGPVSGYSRLEVFADAFGVVCIAASGGAAEDCDGLVGGNAHGVCGGYTLTICPPSPSADLHFDGFVDGIDLGLLPQQWNPAPF